MTLNKLISNYFEGKILRKIKFDPHLSYLNRVYSENQVIEKAWLDFQHGKGLVILIQTKDKGRVSILEHEEIEIEESGM